MKGIVTKQTETVEGDRLLSVFTEEYGIIKLLCRSAGRTRGKNSAMSQFLCYGEFSTYGNSDIPLLNTSSPIDNFYALQTDIKKLALASYFSDIVYGFLGLNDPDAHMYRLFLNTIYALCYNEDDTAKVKAVFEARAVCAAGYMPQLMCCHECGDTDAFYFDTERGETFCENCRGGKQIRLSPGAREAFKYMTVCELKKIFSFTASDAVIAELGTVCEKYILGHLGYVPESLTYFKKIQ